MDKFDLRLIRFFNLIAVLFVVFICFCIVYIVTFDIMESPVKPNINEIYLEYKMPPHSENDSLYLETNKNNNEYLLSQVKDQLISFEKRYESVLCEKEKNNSKAAIISSLIALFVSIAGFFGFKSVNEIKQASIDSAKDVANKEAKREAQTIAFDVANKKIDEEMQKINSIKEDTIGYISAHFMDFVRENSEEIASIINNVKPVDATDTPEGTDLEPNDPFKD